MRIAAAQFKVTCRLCSKPRDPREFVGDVRTGYCWDCYTWHRKALNVLAGDPPTECQLCGVKVADLVARYRSARFVLVPKDGVYQILCKPCEMVYAPKRRDLFERTPYWERVKVRAA